MLPTANTNTQWSCARPRCAMALCCRCDSFDKAIHPIYCHGNIWKDRKLPPCVKVHLGPTIPVCNSWRPRMPFAVGKGTFANSSGLCKVQLAVVCDYLQVDKVSCPVSAWFRHSMKLLRQLIFSAISLTGAGRGNPSSMNASAMSDESSSSYSSASPSSLWPSSNCTVSQGLVQ